MVDTFDSNCVTKTRTIDTPNVRGKTLRFDRSIKGSPVLVLSCLVSRIGCPQLSGFYGIQSQHLKQIL